MSFRRVALLSVLVSLGMAAEDAPRWPALRRYEPMAVPADNPLTPAKVALGRQLFFDKRLSGDSSTSCTSCHRPSHGLTDGRRNPVGAYGVPSGRACPTLWNVGYQQAFFWEGSAASLEQAVSGVWTYILVPKGPGRATPDAVIARLNAIPGYRAAFQAAFGEPATRENLPRALASFLRTLVAEESAWMRFKDGAADALGPAARRGFAVFDGKARCTQCHNGLLLTDLQFHNVGIGSGAARPDPGRFAITGVEANRGAFKTPTLLNIARSAPYFHDGSVATLEEAVDLMAGGGIANPHRDAALAPVALSAAERADLLAFLRSLSVDVALEEPVLPQ